MVVEYGRVGFDRSRNSVSGLCEDEELSAGMGVGGVAVSRSFGAH